MKRDLVSLTLCGSRPERVLNLYAREGLRFTGDEGAIQTALSTLLENAVKYSLPEGEIGVSLRKHRRSLILEVSNPCAPDEGRDLDRLFDRFYRADASRSKESGGYGIGLSVALAIAEKHGGTLRAERRDDRIAFVCALKNL